MIEQNQLRGAVIQGLFEEKIVDLEISLQDMDATMKNQLEEEVQREFLLQLKDNKNLNLNNQELCEQTINKICKNESFDPFSSLAMSYSLYNFVKKFNIDDIGKTKIRDGEYVIKGKYKVGKELAAGGYGIVYECENMQDLVIKVEPVGRSPEDFYNEIKIQNSIS